MSDAGYRIGRTIASIIAADGWQEAYAGLVGDVVPALATVDHMLELITHRFSTGSKTLLET